MEKCSLAKDDIKVKHELLDTDVKRENGSSCSGVRLARSRLWQGDMFLLLELYERIHRRQIILICNFLIDDFYKWVFCPWLTEQAIYMGAAFGKFARIRLTSKCFSVYIIAYHMDCFPRKCQHILTITLSSTYMLLCATYAL